MPSSNRPEDSMPQPTIRIQASPFVATCSAAAPVGAGITRVFTPAPVPSPKIQIGERTKS